ncbi:hypothetical protein RYX36_026855 [Vicia faba]
MAGCFGKSVKVELNGTAIRFESFRDYADLFLKCAEKSKPMPLPRIHAKIGDRWEICVSLSDGQFQQVSFLNSIATIKGGTHVDYITNQITAYIMNKVNKKKKDAHVKAHTVKNHLWVFVNALIDNPAFDSQTKETLTTRQASFGSKCDVPESMLKDVEKSGIVDTLLSWADFKQSKDLKKTDGTTTHPFHYCSNNNNNELKTLTTTPQNGQADPSYHSSSITIWVIRKTGVFRKKDGNKDYQRQREVIDFVKKTQAWNRSGGRDHAFVLTGYVKTEALFGRPGCNVAFER